MSDLAPEHSGPGGVAATDEKTVTPTRVSEERQENKVHGAAEKGFVATDSHGDSLVRFDPQAESRLRRKLDWSVIPMVSLLYLFASIDRSNIGNARLAGFEKDLGLQGNDYNVVLSVFYISYIVFEVPATVTCKWMGPGWFIPLVALIFGFISVMTAFVNDLSSACGVRFLLGIFEAGMMPCISYYLSRWYRRSELAFRLSLFVVMTPLAGAFSGLIASGILTIDHIGSLHSWRMIFAVEGIITIGLSLVAFAVLTDRPETARWLSAEEKDLAIARLKSERVGQTAVLDKMDRKKLWLGFWNPVVLSTAFVFLLNNITAQGLAFFTPTVVATIYPEKTVVQQQLLTVPPYVVGAFFEVLLPYLSWRTDRRQAFLVMTAPLVMVGYAMFLATTDPQVRYAAAFLNASSCFVVGALSNAQVSANVLSDTSRTIAFATNMTGGNIGGLIATWSYLKWDGPFYPIGNGLNLAASSMILLVSAATLVWMNRDNRRRQLRDVDRELHGLTTQQIESLEWKHPGFRWRP